MTTQKQSTRRRLRGARTRYIQARRGVTRVVVHLSNKHAYLQLVSAQAKVLTFASTVEKEVRAECKNGGNQAAAELIGKRFAQKVKALPEGQAGKIGFDRNGFRYAGRVKVMAEAMRAEGIQF